MSGAGKRTTEQVSFTDKQAGVLKGMLSALALSTIAYAYGIEQGN